jgi:hypothetical protein
MTETCLWVRYILSSPPKAGLEKAGSCGEEQGNNEQDHRS